MVSARPLPSLVDTVMTITFVAEGMTVVEVVAAVAVATVVVMVGDAKAMRCAALFVQPNSCYANLQDVDAWT